MTTDTIPISSTAKTTLLKLAASLGRPAEDVLEAAIGEYRNRHSTPVGEIEGIDPADVWAAYAEADAGKLIGHEELMARLRARPSD